MCPTLPWAIMCTAVVALPDLIGGHVQVIRNLREKNGIGATRHAGRQDDPAGVPSHEFDDEHAVVAFGGGMQLIQRLHRGRDRRVKADGTSVPYRSLSMVLGTPTTCSPFCINS